MSVGRILGYALVQLNADGQPCMDFYGRLFATPQEAQDDPASQRGRTVTLTVPEWHAAAACRPGQGANADWFYFPDGAGRGAPVKASYEVPAKATCGRCTVRVNCLLDALHRNEQHGIWGGLNEHERAILRRQLALPAHQRDEDCLRKLAAAS